MLSFPLRNVVNGFCYTSGVKVVSSLEMFRGPSKAMISDSLYKWRQQFLPYVFSESAILLAIVHLSAGNIMQIHVSVDGLA